MVLLTIACVLSNKMGKCDHKNSLHFITRPQFEIWIIFPYFGQIQTDGQTESDAYEPAVQFAQVGSKNYLR